MFFKLNAFRAPTYSRIVGMWDLDENLWPESEIQYDIKFPS